MFRILRRDRLPRQVSAGEVEYGRQHEGDDHENEQARQLARLVAAEVLLRAADAANDDCQAEPEKSGP